MYTSETHTTRSGLLVRFYNSKCFTVEDKNGEHECGEWEYSGAWHMATFFGSYTLFECGFKALAESISEQFLWRTKYHMI